jgi:hypothetical protein
MISIVVAMPMERKDNKPSKTLQKFEEGYKEMLCQAFQDSDSVEY